MAVWHADQGEMTPVVFVDVSTIIKLLAGSRGLRLTCDLVLLSSKFGLLHRIILTGNNVHRSVNKRGNERANSN